jgi:hypothetical protein
VFASTDTARLLRCEQIDQLKRITEHAENKQLLYNHSMGAGRGKTKRVTSQRKPPRQLLFSENEDIAERLREPFSPAFFSEEMRQITSPVIMRRYDKGPDELREFMIALFSDGKKICAASARGINSNPGSSNAVGRCELVPYVVGKPHNPKLSFDQLQDEIQKWVENEERGGYEVVGGARGYAPEFILEHFKALREHLGEVSRERAKAMV